MSLPRDLYRTFVSALPPKWSLAIQQFRHIARWPDIDHPQTFNEKVLHRKLNEQNQRFAELSDKVAVKDFVARFLGEKYVVPTTWAGVSLPEDTGSWERPFVVKANHASGWNYFVLAGQVVDWAAVRRESQHWLESPWSPWRHERWYNRMPRQLLVEPVIGDGTASLSDYKFFVFDGVVRMVQVDINRFTDHRRALYSPDWKRLPVRLHYPMAKRDLPPPMHLAEMLEIASRLGQDSPFVRIDLYDLPEGPKFGEITFAPGGGTERFTPAAFDRELGASWTGPVV